MSSRKFIPQKKAQLTGFTLIELLTVILVIAILAGILIPALSGVRRSALNTKDHANLKSIFTALNVYALDHDGRLPTGSDYLAYAHPSISVYRGRVRTSTSPNYVDDLRPYISDINAFISPLNPELAGAASFQPAYKLRLAPWWWGSRPGRSLRMVNFQYPSKQIMAHAQRSTDPDGSNEAGFNLNVVFADGHTEQFFFYPTYNKQSGMPDRNWFNAAPTEGAGVPMWHGNPNTSWDSSEDPGLTQL